MAYVFWRPGALKIKHWDATVSLFKFEYKVPYISPVLAAYCATIIELVCPVLLVVGLLTRVATIPLLIMIAIIQATFMSHHDHMYWALLLGTLMLKGAGPFSLDALYSRRYPHTTYSH
jgi:putative oxidoreductase